ncbi:DUF779 domain-containing protein [Nocardia sp. NPDC058176]|uniref:DUF779 domain-containing protein n=1 Tax=Nocardia sp. NPDC058176 TaxID=3346368 RepID=UPI0036DA7AAC
MLHHAGSAQRERHLNGRKLDHRHRAVATSDDARHVLQLLNAMHGPVVLYLPADADGYTPICVRRSDFRPEPGDILAGQTAWHTEFWMADRFHVGLDDIDVSVDVRTRPGDEPGTSSLETACGFRFALRIHRAEDELVEEAS